MPRGDAEAMLDGLEELWIASIGPVRNLSRDLEALKRFFDPVATGRRVRRELAGLPEPPSNARRLEPPQVLRIGGDRLLITPEGRVSLGLLRDALVDEGDPVRVNDQAASDAQTRLLRTYREWSRHRLDQTVGLLSGDAEPLRIPSIGFVLVLLVNRSIGEDHALPGRSEFEKLRVVEDAIFSSAAAFANEVDGARSRLRPDRESLYRGWWAGEARRRLPGTLEIEGGVHVKEGGEDQLIELAARELARRDIDRATVAKAFDALVTQLRDREPELAQFKLAFERPPETRRLRERLLEAFDREVKTTAE